MLPLGDYSRQRRSRGRGGEDNTAGGRNGVFGPTSALSQYFRDRGISINSLREAREAQEERNRQAEDAERTRIAHVGAVLEAFPEHVEQDEAEAGAEAGREAEEGGEEAEEGGEEAEEESGEEENGLYEQASEQIAVPLRRKKKRHYSDDYDDDAGGNDAPAPDPNNPASFSYSRKPLSGSVIFCAECACRFTYTLYSKLVVTEDGRQGFLCRRCTSGETQLSKGKKAIGIKRRRAEKEAALTGATFRIPRLSDICIRQVAAYIDHVDALGDIGLANMDSISFILCKNRALTPRVASLFFDVGRESLVLKDCSALDSTTYYNMAQFCPNLVSLHIDACGGLTDSVLRMYADHLQRLENVTFGGPYLVTEAAWVYFFETMGSRLKGFTVTNTARFSEAALAALGRCCVNVERIELESLNNFPTRMLTGLYGLRNLRELAIRNPQETIASAELVRLLSAVGAELRVINLDGNPAVEDDVLQCIQTHCPKLQSLSLAECELLTSEGFVNLFTNWQGNAGLTHMNMTRCFSLGDEGLLAGLKHSRLSLTSLLINSAYNITRSSLDAMVQLGLPHLEVLDASFVRELDDENVEKLSNVCPKLTKIIVWGDNHVSAFCRPRKGVVIIGREAIVV